VDYTLIGYAYNNNVYQFLVHKSSIEDIYPNTIMKLINVTLFEDVFPRNEARENRSLKRMIEASSRNHDRLKDDKVDFRWSRKEKKSKYLVLIF
jgi:hypothetical protein